MTDLKDKAIDIKGKQYVQVKDRVLAFNADYPNGSIQTSLVTDPQSELVVIKAKVTPDCKNLDRFFTGFSQAVVGHGSIPASHANSVILPIKKCSELFLSKRK